MLWSATMTDKRIAKIKHVASLRRKDLVVVLIDLFDPHNAAAIFRTCESFGVQDVYLVFENEKVFDPKKIGKKSSSSANKWLDFHAFTNIEECIGKLKTRGFTVVGSVLSEKAEKIGEYIWPKKTALLLGNEHSGLSIQTIKKCDKHVYIPMCGMIQSLNVSVAAGILIADLCGKRKESKKCHFTTQEQGILVSSFMKRK
ncbi:MAG: RNA methyltransferase [Candidatus Roizmanbacteria bacterium]|nr:RNA methyltransferase [Candidatus Roizmanbacteria bacterium]